MSELMEDDQGNVFVMVNGQPQPVQEDDSGNLFDGSGQLVDEVEPIPKINPVNAGIHGLAQGVSFGFADEIEAGFDTLGDVLTNGQNMRDVGDIMSSFRQSLGRVHARTDALTSEYPITSAVADVGGSLVSGAGALKGLGAYAPKGWLGNTAMGGVEGAVQSYGRSDDRDPMTASKLVKDLLVGSAFGLGGHMAGEAIGRGVRSLDYTPNAPRLQQAADLDIKLSPAQRYNAPALHKVEASMRADPGYSQAFEEMDAHNQGRANQILSEQWGKRSDVITEVEAKALKKNISDKFKAATERGDMIALDMDWVDDLEDVRRGYNSNLGKRDASAPIIDEAQQLLFKDGGQISPARYQQYYSKLGKDMDAAYTRGDHHEGTLFRGIRDSLDRVVDRTTGGLSQEFQEARNLYKIQKLAEKPGVLDVGTGNMSPLTLANKLNQIDKQGYFYGGNDTDLYKLARLAKATRSGIGDSGTGTRSKTMLDHLLSPIKAELGNAYNAGPLGTALTAGTSGAGAKVGMPAANAGVSALEIQKQIEELEQELGL